MFLFNIILINILIACIYVASSNGEIESNAKHQTQRISSDGKILHLTADIVNIQVYYECLCHYCKVFMTTGFKVVVQQLSNYLNISTYPYGNARMYIGEDGKFTFRCQHGPMECYRNMLHACALNIIKNHTQALLYNSCMMDFADGSDDNAANKCGELMNIDTELIKACAKNDMGANLLKNYGFESQRVNFHHVPYIRVNGKESDRKNFIKDICAAFVNPPPPCASLE